MLTMGTPETQVSLRPQTHQSKEPIPLSSAALAEAEAAHVAQGLRLHEARRAQEQWAVETTMKAAEQAAETAKRAAEHATEHAQREEEASQAMHVQVHHQLQALVAAEAEATHAFAEK